jgi:membrane protease YdiL (CAAX protease family)
MPAQPPRTALAAPAGALLLAPAVHLLFVTAVAAVAYPRGVLDPVVAATHGLLSSLLLVALAGAAVLAPVLVVAGVDPRPAFSSPALRTALGLLVAVWASVQAVGLGAGIARGDVALVGFWLAETPLGVGLLLGQLANAVLEETVYRWLVFGGLLAALHRTRLRAVPGAPALFAGTGATAAFVLVHVPNRLLWWGVPPSALGRELVPVAAIGAVLCLAYWRTANLPLVVGLHALLNVPVALLSTQATGRAVVTVATLFLVLAWPRLRTLGVVADERLRIDPET